MEIKRYQAGGIVYTPFVRGSSAQGTSQNATSSNKKEDNELQKAIFSVLNENGLPNDVDYFLNQANALLLSSTDMYGNPSYSVTDLIKLHSLANKIKHNNTAHTTAVTRLETENSGSEVAITNNGGLYVQDENGKLKTISIDNYYRNSDKYIILTQTDLMNYRENDPSLAYNSTILNDISSTIGLGTIVKHLQTSINAFGTDTIEDKSDKLTLKEKGKVEKGMENILNGSSPDGIYNISTNITSEHQGYDKSTNEGLYEAANYLWSTLNSQMKNTIRAHTVAEGLNPNKAEDVYRILISAIQEHTDHKLKRNVDISYDASASKAAGIGNVESNGAPTQEVFGNRVLKNQGNYRPSYLMMGDSKIKNILPTYHYNHIPDKEGNEIPNVTLLSETYRNLQDHGIIDTRRTAYFGSLPISNMAIAGTKILVNNMDDGGNVVYMPIDVVGNIDMGMFTKMMNIQKSIQANRITDESKIKQIWEDNGFDYNSELGVGQPKNYKLAPYWMQNAYTSSSQDIFDKSDLNESSLIAKVDRSLVEDLSNVYNLDPVHSKNTKVEIQSGFGGTDYQAMIYIPLSSDQGEALFAGGASYISKEMSDNLHATMQAYQRTGMYDPFTNQYNHIQTFTGNELD